jgi:hypothetical protein
MIPDLKLNSFAQLKKNENFLKKCYNQYRPHGSLQKKTDVILFGPEKAVHFTKGQ